MSCPHCNDTGSMSKNVFGYLDCTKCDVGNERARLELWASANLSGRVDSSNLWRIYQHGKKAAQAVPA